jgi:glucose-1-phosphatase
MTFLFDIGRVLLDFDFESSLAAVPARHCPMRRAPRPLLERKDEFETGGSIPTTYTDWALGVLGTTATADEFHHAWRRIFTPNEPMWACVRQLKADGHRLILFSNTNAIHCPWMLRRVSRVLALRRRRASPSKPASSNPTRRSISTPSRPTLVPAGIHALHRRPPAKHRHRPRFGFHTWQYDLKDHAAFERWLALFAL